MAVQQAAFVEREAGAIGRHRSAARSASNQRTVVATAAVAPTRASVTQVAPPGAKVAQPPAALQARAVVAKRTPPPPPVPFAQKQAGLGGQCRTSAGHQSGTADPAETARRPRGHGEAGAGSSSSGSAGRKASIGCCGAASSSSSTAGSIASTGPETGGRSPKTEGTPRQSPGRNQLPGAEPRQACAGKTEGSNARRAGPNPVHGLRQRRNPLRHPRKRTRGQAGAQEGQQRQEEGQEEGRQGKKHERYARAIAASCSTAGTS